MPSKAQEDFFENLLKDRDFGDKDTTEIAVQFLKLGPKSASEWIERALSLPKKDESDETKIPPPF
jgi:hypothetical protein